MKLITILKKSLFIVLFISLFSCQPNDDAFFTALSEKQYDTARKYLLSGKINPDYRNEHDAVESIKILIDNGANPEIKNNEGNTPLHLSKKIQSQGNHYAFRKDLLLIISRFSINGSSLLSQQSLYLRKKERKTQFILYFSYHLLNIFFQIW